MRKALPLLLFFIVIGFTDLSAQDTTLVTVKAGYKVKDVLKQSDIFHYPQFTNGMVFFLDGSKGAAKLNYSRLVEQMLFIGPKGDTLALANEKNIKFIAIDRDTFYYDEGYLRLLANEGDVKLAEKQVWVVADIRKGGTHNKSTNTVAITSMNMITDESAAAKSKDLIINEDMILRRETHYYFGDRFNHFARAGKKAVLQLFKEQAGIENYLKENKVNFDKKDDLEKLAQFLAKDH